MRGPRSKCATARIWLLGLAGVACGDAPMQADPVTRIRDSAGIAIVENRMGRSPDTCQASQSFRIGQVTGAAEYELHRVFDSTMLSDGSVAIVQDDGRVRFFGPDGRFRDEFGRRGGGPGEFRIPLLIQAIRGDTLVIGDQYPWRFSYFDRAGEYIEAFTPHPPVMSGPVASVLEDGRILLGIECCSPRDLEEYVDLEMTLLLFSRHGAADTLGVFWSKRVGRVAPRVLRRPIFGADAALDSRPGGFVYGAGSRPEIELRTLDGRLERLVRWSPGPREVRAADVEAYRTERMAALGEASSLVAPLIMEDVAEDRPVADTFPGLATVAVAASGDLWVLMYPLPRETDRRWLVFGPEGRFRCLVRLPRLRVHEVGSNYIRGLELDEWDVEYVVEYGIRHP